MDTLVLTSFAKRLLHGSSESVAKQTLLLKVVWLHISLVMSIMLIMPPLANRLGSGPSCVSISIYPLSGGGS